MRKKTTDELASKLAYHSFLRMLLVSVWFRLAVLAALCFVVGLALFLPKIWRTTPEDFVPVVKISGLDRLQAWSLRRSAQKKLAAKQYEDALLAWQMAWANNPGDPGLLRGWLQTCLAAKAPLKRAELVPLMADWLMRLSHTNRVDLELVAQALFKSGFKGLALDVLRPWQSELSPALEALYLKVVFERGDYGQFERRWQAVEGCLPKDPELVLYRAAYLAGWGPAETAAEARQQLAGAQTAGPHQILANRLQLAVSRRLDDLRGCESALRRLEDERADTLTDHVVYWRLLAVSGRKKEAADLAQSYLSVPTLPSDTILLAETCVALGLAERAQELMLWHLEKRGFDPDVCLAYLALLVDTKNWEDLRALGAKIRLRSNLPETLTAFGYFAEGWAELAQRRTNQAKQAFDKIKAFKIDEPSLAVAMAERLVNAGYVEYAIALLWKLEPQLSNRSVFWLVLTQVAYVQKDNDLLLRAAKRAYELAPDDLIAVNNYAAALLINRVQPEEAIKLTLQLVRQMPMSLVAVVNHATALLLNKRSLEAQELLGQVDAGRLTAEESAQYYRAMFELWLNLDKLAQAREAYQRIDKRLLYRVQVRWLEETLEKLPPPSG